MFKVIICGSRTFNSLSYLTRKCDYLLQNKNDVEIVTGMARGADYLGGVYAYNKGFEVHGFPADWENNGKSAGYKRNIIMGNYADVCIAFWDGESKGTKHMIEYMKSKNKRVVVIKYLEDKNYISDY